jgi:hypothetical protein
MATTMGVLRFGFAVLAGTAGLWLAQRAFGFEVPIATTYSVRFLDGLNRMMTGEAIKAYSTGRVNPTFPDVGRAT